MLEFLFNKDSNKVGFKLKLVKFREQVFLQNTSGSCFYQFDKVTSQKQNVGWFLLKRFVDLVRVCSSHIILIETIPKRFR